MTDTAHVPHAVHMTPQELIADRAYKDRIREFEDRIDAALAALDFETAEKVIAERREFRLSRGEVTA